MNIKELPFEERPREKLASFGPQFLSTSELLAILLRTGTKDKSALHLANELLFDSEDGLVFLSECTLQELAAVKGIGTTKACQILAAVELGKRIVTRRPKNQLSIDSPESIAALFLGRLRDKRTECFKALLLGSKGDIIAVEDIAEGDMNCVTIKPREVFHKAIRRNAAMIVLVHNHPSGSPLPSQDDIRTTKRLAAAGEVLGIRVIDHIIIGDGTYVSLGERGLLQAENIQQRNKDSLQKKKK